jgi:ribosome-associated translation inhibitor RaiA
VLAALGLTVEDEIPDAQREAARRELEALARYTDEPLEVRATLRRAHGGRGERPYVVDARAVVDGRAYAAHASGSGAKIAAERAAERLRRQLRHDVAERNDPRALQKALADLPLEPRLPAPEKTDRRINRHRTTATGTLSTYQAIEQLIREDKLFLLFVHERTLEDVVCHRREKDFKVGLLHPPGSALAGEGDDVVVVPEPSRYTRPLTVAEARGEIEVNDDRFVYFIDVADLRGKVIYRRGDGDYGLVEPE